MMTRDFEQNPYSEDELKVIAYLQEIAPEVGAGDDPIGFLIASHRTISRENKKHKDDLAFGAFTRI